MIIKMQKLKTRVIKKDVNPEWNEDLIFSVTDPSIPVKLVIASSIPNIYFYSKYQKIEENIKSLLVVDLFLCGV